MSMKEMCADSGISGVTRCLEELNNSSANMLWFRGHSDFQYMLRPALFRQGKSLGIHFNEKQMLEEFRRRYPEQSHHHKTTYEWLTLMQHYGLPTRLLDWSSNLLVALYFCCQEQPDKDGAVYALNPTYWERDFKFNEFLQMQIEEETRSEFFYRLVNSKECSLDDDTLLNGVPFSQIKKDIFFSTKFYGLSTDSKEPFESLVIQTKLYNTQDMEGNPVDQVFSETIRAFTNIVPFKAPYLNQRLRQQHGVFTLHGGMYISGEEFIKPEPMEEHPYADNSLLKIRIPAQSKEPLLSELHYAGIREATLFPDMEYQAKEIRDQFSSTF